MSAKLTPTSYALLGLLRLQPWSAYQLTTYMQSTALNFIWPRANAGIYNEPKKLVAHGLATARVEPNAGRRRTIYEITGKGRRALTEWLARPNGEWSFASEAALQVFFADATGIDELQTSLRTLIERVRATYQIDQPLITRWLDEGPRFPGRLHFTAMMADLISSLTGAIDDWASRWLRLSESWPDTTLNSINEAQAREILESLRETLRTRTR